MNIARVTLLNKHNNKCKAFTCRVVSLCLLLSLWHLSPCECVYGMEDTWPQSCSNPAGWSFTLCCTVFSQSHNPAIIISPDTQSPPTGPLDVHAELIFYALLSLSIAATLFIWIDESCRCAHPDIIIKASRFQDFWLHLVFSSESCLTFWCVLILL